MGDSSGGDGWSRVGVRVGCKVGDGWGEGGGRVG